MGRAGTRGKLLEAFKFAVYLSIPVGVTLVSIQPENLELIISDDTVGLATVYRVLTQFEAAGIVNRHNFDDGHSVYELADEVHHDHMVDVDNGEIIEFVNDGIEELQKQIAIDHGYELVHHELVLYVKKKQD